jgi:hypothetical protein
MTPAPSAIREWDFFMRVRSANEAPRAPFYDDSKSSRKVAETLIRPVLAAL